MACVLIRFVAVTSVLVNVCLGMVSGQIHDEDEPIKIETVLLNVPVFVGDKDGRNIVGLQKEDFRIFQKGEEQAIEFFADAEEPINVAILIDTSGSTASRLGSIKMAALDFLDHLGPNDNALIIGFDSRVYSIFDLSSDKKALKTAVRGIRNIEFTERAGEPQIGHLFDAVYKVVNQDFANIAGRKALIVLSDGFESGTKVTSAMLLDTLIESDSTVFPIIFYTNPIPGIPRDKKTITMNELLKIPPFDFLNEIALATGGRVYAADGSNFDTAFKNIADELKKQYVIGFYPTNPEGGKEAPIKITVNRPGAIARAKRTIRLKVPDSTNLKQEDEKRPRKENRRTP
ncbi:MAG: VWA domain-containing protein [Pyrinomonadaceae bacterium]|nr:VWA domain-containing protein [Pyrinomonadaceae bacterium]